jgi:DNA processing protein
MDINAEDSLYKFALNMIPGVGCAGVRKILSENCDERYFFENLDEFVEKKVISSDIRDVVRRQNVLEMAKNQLEICRTKNIFATYFKDADYPRKLAQCNDAPTMFFHLGKLNFDTCRTIGIVGTRSADSDAKNNVFNLVEDLKNDNINFVIVSGLAAGADTFAHQAALRSGVPTAGVLGHGLNMIYPVGNRKLAADMVRANGMLITEYYYGEPVSKTNFPRRNRIVAGLCDCLIVAQSKITGGALITVENSISYRREVFAFPGRVSDKLYAGCNYLISSDKAALITSAADLERLMGWQSVKKGSAAQIVMNLAPLSPDEVKIIDTLRQNGKLYIDTLASMTGIPISKLSSLLLTMEFKDLINSYPGKNFEAK